MVGKVTVVFGIMLLAVALAGCGTIKVTLEDSSDQEDILAGVATADRATAVRPPATEAPPNDRPIEASATAMPPTVTAEAAVAEPAAESAAPADWLRFYTDEYGIELWHPPGTVAEIGEPARPEFSSADFPDGIVEEQLFVVQVFQQEGGALGPPGPQAILEVKLVTNPEGKSIGEAAERYSYRCPGERTSPQPTTVNVQLSGYRYGCEGIDAQIFNEFWAPYPADPQLLFGAAWADMFAPLADEILTTVSFVGQ